MPITKSAKKALRQNKRKRAVNLKRLNKIRLLTRQLKKFTQDKKIKEAQNVLSEIYQALDKAAKKNVLSKNASARKKSRLAKAIKKISFKF